MLRENINIFSHLYKMGIYYKKTISLGKLKDRLLEREGSNLFFFQFIKYTLSSFEDRSYLSIINDANNPLYLKNIFYKYIESLDLRDKNKLFNNINFIINTIKKILISSFHFYEVIKYEIKIDRFFFDYQDIMYYYIYREDYLNLCEEEIFIYILSFNINQKSYLACGTHCKDFTQK